jgi:hypothetical protein
VLEAAIRHRQAWPWLSRFQRLFDLRDAAVHAKVKLLPAVPHPSGVSNAGQVNADHPPRRL